MRKMMNIALSVTVIGFIIISFWMFSQTDIDNAIGYTCLMLAGLVLSLAKLAYSAGVEEAQYVNSPALKDGVSRAK